MDAYIAWISAERNSSRNEFQNFRKLNGMLVFITFENAWFSICVVFETYLSDNFKSSAKLNLN